MAKKTWLCAVPLSMLCCDALFGDMVPPPPATTATLDPTVSFPTGLDCSGTGATPISVSWDIRPIMLDVGGLGVGTEFSTQEILNNTSGTPTNCFYTPPSTESAASSTGLHAGVWQLTLTHDAVGYPNPIVCTKQLVNGANDITFVIEPQTAGCQ